MAYDIIVNGTPNPTAAKDPQEAQRDELVQWIMARVNRWREHRDMNYLDRWSEYYRLWRGFWAPKDQNKEAERSRLIAPALQQAIDMTVSEMEEATFGRGVWVDVSDDVEDEQKEDMIVLRDKLLYDLDREMVPAAVSESYLNGALYGTGIGKVMIGRGPDKRFKVWLEAVAPQNFVIDPGARTIDEALGCAHEIAVPKHNITKKQVQGFYYKNRLSTWDGTGSGFDETGKMLVRETDRSDLILITEYHGLVPKKFLDVAKAAAKGLEEIVAKDREGSPIVEDGELVEAIVTIANKQALLRAVENPYDHKDRAIVAYQHETVPGRFWGRGVSEKGYNPQKALDAELRARIDSLAYLTYPILGADATRLPRGFDPRIRPGRTFLTNGRPSEILEPIVFGNLNPATFQQSGDLERMVQMGTGAMDSASPLETNRRNETVGGMSMIQGGFIKRSKRTMQNVERQFLDKIVQKAMWRYMQFDEERYPRDFEFQVNATMGIMAREFEQTTLTQMLQVIPPESPLFPVVIKGIVENSASANKAELVQAVQQMMKPDPAAQEAQQKMQQLQQALLEGQVQEIQAKAQLAQAQAHKAMADAKYAMVKADLEDDLVEIKASAVVVQAEEAKNNREHARLEQTYADNDAVKAEAAKKKASQKPKGPSK